jgi:hypothetical protein
MGLLRSLIKAAVHRPWDVVREGHPNDVEVRMSEDGTKIAIWEPGNEPWFVIDTAQVRGTWVPGKKMDKLDWERFFPLREEFK